MDFQILRTTIWAGWRQGAMGNRLPHCMCLRCGITGRKGSFTSISGIWSCTGQTRNTVLAKPRGMPPWRVLCTGCLQPRIWCIRMGNPGLSTIGMTWWPWRPRIKMETLPSWRLRRIRERALIRTEISLCRKVRRGSGISITGVQSPRQAAASASFPTRIMRRKTEGSGSGGPCSWGATM